MSSFARAAAAIASTTLLLMSPLYAQRGGGDWTTIGNDAQRSNWLRGDARISPEVMKKPGFELLWKLKLNNVTRQMSGITPPALLDFYIGYRGFRTLGFFGGSSDTVIAVDTDLARIEWEKHLGAPGAAAGTPQCPGGMTSSVSRITSSGYPAAGGGRGRGNPAASGVGEPGEGAVTLKNRPAAPNFPGPPPAAGGRVATAPNPFGRTPLFAYALTGDGKLHLMYVSNGEEPNPAIPFLPPNARAVGLIAAEGMAYVATVNGCGGVANGVWAVDLETKKVSQWNAPGGANIAGSMGLALSPDGDLYVAAGSEIVALDRKTLAAKSSYKSGGAAFTSSPLIFDQKGKDVIAATANDGKIHLVDPAGMTAVGSGTGVGDYPVGALASWQDAGGTRWLMAPAAGKVVAWKVSAAGTLEPGWSSREMVSPLTPAIVNGVVFAVSAGKRGVPAVLYALDAATGKDVWSSGKAMASYVTSGGLSAGGGRVYVSTQDGVQYAFGIPMEH